MLLYTQYLISVQGKNILLSGKNVEKEQKQTKPHYNVF